MHMRLFRRRHETPKKATKKRQRSPAVLSRPARLIIFAARSSTKVKIWHFRFYTRVLYLLKCVTTIFCKK